jgi:nucleotide-binding universal stress UspA family protein
MKILVGVDFSPGSQRAVDHALTVARHVGAELVLAYVGVVAEPPVGLAPSMKATAETWRGLLGSQLERERAQLGELRERLEGQGVDVSHVVLDGFADTALAEAARTIEAGLVVVGTHGRTGLQRFLLGSVAEHTVRAAHTSVLVARGDAPAGGYRKIVVGTDFSEQAERAIDQALVYAAPGAEIRVVHAWALPLTSADLPGSFAAQLRESSDAAARELETRLRAREVPEGTTISVEAVVGAPAVVLDARSEGADLVVVGSRGRRGLKRFLLGSVAEVTVRHARCTVLVAR